MPLNDEPDISLVVNTFEKPRHLALVLESIAKQQGVDGRFEVIVTDDGSGEATRDIVASFGSRMPFRVAFTTAPHDGFRLARTRNRGARIARGRTLLFLDGDCVIPRDHVAAHLDRRRPGRALLCFCARLDEATSRGLDAADLGRDTVRRITPRAEKAALAARHRKIRWHNFIRHRTKPRLAGGNFSVWRSDFERVNGFDERFRGWGQEDDDLGLRLRAVGVSLESVLDRTFSLHVWHPTDPSATPRWRDGPNVAYFHRRGRLAVCREGLSQRSLADLAWRLPDELANSDLGRKVVRLLGEAGVGPCEAEGRTTPAPSRTEIDLVVRPGDAIFNRGHGRADCRLLITGVDWPAPRGRNDRGVMRQADVVAAVEDPAGASLLERLESLI